jgi:hypothetical protein
VTSERFEALSLEALYALAERLNLDLPPGLERIFVVEEILDALEEESEERRGDTDEAVHVEEKKFSCREIEGLEPAQGEAPALERRYNETMIRAIVRDPSWAFAFWDLADADAPPPPEEGGPGLFLRVVELGPGEEEKRKSFFDIPVSRDDLQWYINLPVPGVRFRIDLCARRGDGDAPAAKARHTVLARSNPVAAPRQALAGPDRLDPVSVRLLGLSGLEALGLGNPESRNSRRILPDGADASGLDTAAGRG